MFCLQMRIHLQRYPTEMVEDFTPLVYNMHAHLRGYPTEMDEDFTPFVYKNACPSKRISH